MRGEVKRVTCKRKPRPYMLDKIIVEENMVRSLCSLVAKATNRHHHITF